MSAHIALVGVGPRGVAVALRLVADHAAVAPGVRVHVHLIDAVAVGPGRTWRQDQSAFLLNNTYCAETTAFADDTVPTAGPTCEGPDLVAWTQLVTRHPEGFAPGVAAEASVARAWTFPSRRLQGTYYRWALEQAFARAGRDVSFHEHVGRVVALDDEADGVQRITFADGTRLRADAVVLAQGMLTAGADPETRALETAATANGVTYVAPGMPAERDWGVLAAGAPVIVRGLGANFFDLIGVLFEGRGGRFARGRDGRLRYTPSGREPVLLAASRHGLPYRAKAYYPRGLPAPVELPRFSARREAQLVRGHGGRADVDAGAELLPEILADLRDVFAGMAGDADCLDWDRIVFPTAGRTFATEGDWAGFLDAYFEGELERIHHPEQSAEKTVHRAVETARRRLARLVLARVIDPVSVVRDLKRTFLPQALVVASGPPPERLERLVALREAGLVEILGPGLRVSIDGGAVHAATDIPGQRRTASALAEARMKLGDLRTADDPLVAQLLRTGQARFHRAGGSGGVETDTLDVTPDGFLMVDAAGRPHDRRVVLGPPAGDVQWYSAIGAVPGTGDKLLAGADVAAAHALRVAARAAVDVAAGQGRASSGTKPDSASVAASTVSRNHSSDPASWCAERV